MVKELELAKIKRELLQAKETIADLEAENRKLHARVIDLESVRKHNIAKAYRLCRNRKGSNP